MTDSRGAYNDAISWPLDDAEERLGREWLGYGSLNAPYWFAGLEPGGTYDPLFARYWLDSLDAAPLFDPRLDARTAPNPWFQPDTQAQPTWKPLIETVLGYVGSTDDPLDYQLRRFGYVPPLGEMAVIELSAFAAKGSKSQSPHRFTFLDERVNAIRDALRTQQPAFAVFYGTSQRVAFSKIVDGFGADGFKMVGSTVCALVPHPAAHGPRRDWRKFGCDLRARIEA
jgi:hypothetical protein